MHYKVFLQPVKRKKKKTRAKVSGSFHRIKIRLIISLGLGKIDFLPSIESKTFWIDLYQDFFCEILYSNYS